VFGENLVRAAEEEEPSMDDLDLRELMQRQTQLMEEMKEYMRVSMEAILSLTQHQKPLVSQSANMTITGQEQSPSQSSETAGTTGAGTELLAFMGLQAEQGQ